MKNNLFPGSIRAVIIRKKLRMSNVDRDEGNELLGEQGSNYTVQRAHSLL